MAPSSFCTFSTQEGIESTWPTYSTQTFGYYSEVRHLKKETKKERIQRIATEKRFASWDLHNKKKENIKQVIQMCKPRHKLNHMGGRKF